SAAPWLCARSASALAHFSTITSRSSAWCRAYSSQPSSSCTLATVCVMVAMTSSRCSGLGTMVATTTTDTMGSLAAEDRAQGGCDVGVAADPAQPSVAQAGQLTGE